ncbi:hypothetical protein BpHYR1_037679 [Brachionus plicatilis]|uniref:Uncharacterized protein n=1 Tax=Brachionus plicatilis TaxID=10195 RepID=A0A3M7QX34_BRAPC|nr:hypothetical protein BpHYR1_037679 [Brachionus plicatilis]
MHSSSKLLNSINIKQVADMLINNYEKELELLQNEFKQGKEQSKIDPTKDLYSQNKKQDKLSRIIFQNLSLIPDVRQFTSRYTRYTIDLEFTLIIGFKCKKKG